MKNKIYIIAADDSNQCVTGELMIEIEELPGRKIEQLRRTLESAYSFVHGYACEIWFEHEVEKYNH